MPLVNQMQSITGTDRIVWLYCGDLKVLQRKPMGILQIFNNLFRMRTAKDKNLLNPSRLKPP